MSLRITLVVLTGALGSLLAAPVAAQAQQAVGRMPRIGFLLLGELSAPITVRTRESLRRGLQEEGYLEGRNITIEYRYADSEGLRKAANDLVRLNVDVISANGTAGALAARQATATIPIVAGAMADPLADGLVASLARPGGNVTGNTFLGPELGPKRLQLLKEVVPGATRIAALLHPGVYSERTMQHMVTELVTTTSSRTCVYCQAPLEG